MTDGYYHGYGQGGNYGNGYSNYGRGSYDAAGGPAKYDKKKIFVGGLSWETNGDDMKAYFSKYGEVQDASVAVDPGTGRPKGFGFVRFTDSTTVDRVLEETNHELNGRKIDPKKAKIRGTGGPCKIFVGGVNPETPETSIRKHFERYGEVESIDLPYDKTSQKRRGFCFVSFESEDGMKKACSDRKQVIDGSDVDVKKATPKKEPGFDDGFGTGGGDWNQQQHQHGGPPGGHGPSAGYDSWRVGQGGGSGWGGDQHSNWSGGVAGGQHGQGDWSGGHSGWGGQSSWGGAPPQSSWGGTGAQPGWSGSQPAYGGGSSTYPGSYDTSGWGQHGGYQQQYN